jgi:lysophospholipase L1-like esterase
VGGFATGGSATGGTPSGGMPSGGFATGGMPSGGTLTGGVATGGVGASATGGVATGGMSTGGFATGGDATGGAGTGGNPTGGASALEWLPSWATTIQKTEDSNLPPALNNNTLRQFVWPSYPGSEIRIQLSNEKGSGAVDVNQVHIAQAQPLGTGQIDAATDVAFTFSGSASVTIPAGQTAWSDPVAFDLRDMQPTAITMQFGNAVPPEITGHPGARTTSYVVNGDHVSEAGLSGAQTRDRWYFINAIEVMAPADAFAIATLGDSITDGYGVLNQFARWPDFLTIAIKQDAQIADKVSVLNFGAGANNLLSGNGYMDAGVDRVDRDILTRPKVKWVIVLHGVNDIIYSGASSSQVTAGYQQVIQKCHDAGIIVYGSPITPFASHTQGQPLTVRSEVNDWVMTSGAFDTVIDLPSAVADPSDPQQLLTALSNDGLHPNLAGYEAMGNAVDLSLFY